MILQVQTWSYGVWKEYCQPTLDQFKKAKVRKFWKLLLKLKTDNCGCVMFSLVDWDRGI